MTVLPEPSEAQSGVLSSPSVTKGLIRWGAEELEQVPRCSRCILPDTWPGLRLDEDEVCSACRSHRPEAPVLGQEALLRELRAHRAQGQHDCLVPLSGGKDSTYALYYAVRELGLRPMAMEYDGGFQHPLARHNVVSACRALNVPLIHVRTRGRLRARVVKRSLRLSESFGSLVTICGNCEPVLRIAAIRQARRHKLPVVLWAAGWIEMSNYNEYLEGRGLRLFLSRKLAQFRAARLTPGRVLRLLPRLAAWWCWSIIERLSAGIGPWRALRPFAPVPFTSHNPAFIHFYNYVTWDSMRGVELLERELDWRHPQGSDSRFDCDLACFKNLHSMLTRGITNTGVKFAQFIRNGKMSREEALDREIRMATILDMQCASVLERLGLDHFSMTPP